MSIVDFIDQELTKRCRKCGVEKPHRDFTFHNRTSDRRDPWCKACRNADARERWRTRPDYRQKKNDYMRKYMSDYNRATLALNIRQIDGEWTVSTKRAPSLHARHADLDVALADAGRQVLALLKNGELTLRAREER